MTKYFISGCPPNHLVESRFPNSFFRPTRKAQCVDPAGGGCGSSVTELLLPSSHRRAGLLSPEKLLVLSRQSCAQSCPQPPGRPAPHRPLPPSPPAPVSPVTQPDNGEPSLLSPSSVPPPRPWWVPAPSPWNSLGPIAPSPSRIPLPLLCPRLPTAELPSAQSLTHTATCPSSSLKAFQDDNPRLKTGQLPALPGVSTTASPLSHGGRTKPWEAG